MRHYLPSVLAVAVVFVSVVAAVVVKGVRSDESQPPVDPGPTPRVEHNPTAVTKPKPATPTPSVPDNAADAYFESFGLSRALTTKQRETFERWEPNQSLSETDLRPTLPASRADAILEQLRLGAMAERFDWPLRFDDPWVNAGQTVREARLVTKVALWRAKALQATDRRRATDICIDALIMNRRLSRVGSGLAMVIAVANEKAVFEHLAGGLLDLEPATLAHLRKRVAKSDLAQPSAMAGPVMAAQRSRYFPWLSTTFRAAPGEFADRLVDATRADLAVLLPAADADETARRARLIHAIAEQAADMPDAFVMQCSVAARVADAFVTAGAQPPDRAGEALADAYKSAPADNPVAQWIAVRMIDAYEAGRQAELNAQLYTALFRAGLARAEHGHAYFAAMTDPFSGTPFGFDGSDDGFAVSSRWRSDGPPVSMRFSSTKP